ncbi:MAG: hypothetical protein JNK67_09125 [Alphaproteobacteria bacterium]|nr:hypothetical protein [Alphaproteobacteria bacterium]
MKNRTSLATRLLFGASIAALSGLAQAAPVFTDFEAVDSVLVPAAPVPTIVGSPTIGVALDVNSEINDEFKIFRITSGVATSNAGDSFGAVAAWVSLKSPHAAHSGTNVIAGATFGATSLDVDFTNFIEIRVLDPGYKSVKVWVGAIEGGSARMLVTDDLLAGTTLVDTAITVDGFVEFTSPGADIRRILLTPGAGSAGIWIDDLTVDTGTAPPPSTVPAPAGLTLLGPAALAGLVLRRRKQR